MLKDRMTLEHARENAKVQKIIKAKQNLVVAKNIRTTHRSRKPELNIKQNDTVKVDPETEMARLYLGIVVPDDWQSGPNAQEEEKANNAK